MGVIIATVIGCGKSYLIHEYGDNMAVLDMTPQMGNSKDIADEASSRANDFDIVFVRANIGIVDALCDQGTDFDLFYPSKDKANQIVEDLVKKRLDFKAIQEFDNHIGDLIDQLDSIDSEHCFKHKLERGQYLCTDNALNGYLESFNRKKTNTNNESD